MELLPYNQATTALIQDFEIIQIPYTLGKTAKVSKATLRRFEKVLPLFPESLKNFLIQYSNFRFSWSDGKIHIVNALNLIRNLENGYEYEVNNVSYLPLVYSKNTQLLARVENQGLELFVLVNGYVSGQYQQILIPLNWTLEAYIQEAIHYKGIAFWELLALENIPSQLSFLDGQKDVYLSSFKELFDKPITRGYDWQSIINTELVNNANISIKKVQFEAQLLYLPTKIEIETQLGHYIYPTIAQYYQYIRSEISFITKVANRTYSSIKIIGIQELLYKNSSDVWHYLNVSTKDKDRQNYYSFKVFIMQENPIFIDLKSEDAYCLYYYDHSEKEVYPIELPLDAFLLKLFQCKAVEGWERLFIGKSYLDELTIKNIKIVNPDLDIDAFLDLDKKG